MPDLDRKLVAILSADAAGYSRLMADDETATIVSIQASRARIAESVEAKRGRIVDAPGDNVLAEFPTALDAVEAAVAMQAALREQNAELPQERRMEFRIGIHLGDVATDGTHIYGDGVNIAARIEGLADVGGIAVSAEIYGQVRGRLGVEFEDLGEREVKNIPQPVRVYRLLSAGEIPSSRSMTVQPTLRNAIAAAAIVVAVAGIWFFALRDSAPRRDSSDPPEAQPSIAVLPFVNLSADPANEYFSDGLSEELLNSLAQVPGLKVASRTSSFAFKNQNVDLKEVGARLGVAHLLEGSVRKQGQRLRITAQLISAADNYHLWSETYDRQLDDVFEIQADIARRVTDALRIELMQTDADRLATPGTESTEAHDEYLRGLEGVRTFSVDSIVAAGNHFRRAIMHDPDFAQAHAALANSHAFSYFTNSVRPDEMLRVTEPAAARALKLDPELSEAHSARGAVLEVSGDSAGAEAAYRRALALKPSNRDASVLYGFFLFAHVRYAEAIAVYQTAIETAPLDSTLLAFLGQIYRAAGRTGDALRVLGESRAQKDANPAGYFIAAFMHTDELGDIPGGISWFERAIEIDPHDPELVAFLARSYLALGEVEPAIALAERALAVDPDNGFLLATAAVAHAREGNRDRAEKLALRALRPESIRRLGGTLGALQVLRNAWLRDGRIEELAAAYEDSYPTLTKAIELVEGPVQSVHLSASELASAAVDLAHLRAALGDSPGSARLLARSRSVFELAPRVLAMGNSRTDTTLIETLMVEKRTAEALDALEALVDGGWLGHWQWYVEANPIFDAIRSDPRYARVISRLERDTRRQREAVAARD